MRRRGPDTDITKNVRDRIIVLIDEYCDGKQIVFSNKTGIPKGTVSNYVNGKNLPSDTYSRKIADVFNVGLLWIKGYDVPRNSSEKLKPTNMVELLDMRKEKEETIFENVFDCAGYRLEISEYKGLYNVLRFPAGTTLSAQQISITSDELKSFTQNVSDYADLLISKMFSSHTVSECGDVFAARVNAKPEPGIGDSPEKDEELMNKHK